MAIRAQLLALLGDGRLHSESTLGRRLGTGPTRVHQQIQALMAQGIAIEAVPGHGFRLTERVIPLDREAILWELGQTAAFMRHRLAIMEGVDSTNNVLMSGECRADFCGQVCLAEYMTHGRGRRGRHWVSQPFKNIMLSMGWVIDRTSPGVGGLSLAAAVAVLRALRDCGLDGAGIKWPNDILWNERKLAGLLAEIRGEVAARIMVVLGVGINVRIQREYADRIDQPWVDLETILGAPVNRNRLAARLILALKRMFEEFERSGLASFKHEWDAAHLYAGRRVTVRSCGVDVHGIAVGIDGSGALLVRDECDHIRRFWSGDVSVRVS